MKENKTHFYSPADVAEILGLHYQTVLAEIHRGVLNAYNLRGKYKITEQQIETYLKNNQAM